MNHDPEQFDPSDAALDALLAEARWPEATAASSQRLVKFYRSQRPRVVDRRWLIAASLLIACGVAIAIVQWKTASRDVATGPKPSHPVRVDPVQIAEPVEIIVRAPTRLELAQITFIESETRRATDTAARPDLVEEALSALAADQSERGFARAKAILSRLDPRRREAELAHVVFSPDSTRSQAAAGLIASMADEESIPLLMQMDRTAATRDAAVRGISAVASPPLLARLARSHVAPDHRQSLIAGLFRRADGMAIYLNLVSDHATSSDALAALERVQPPPTELFFAALSDPHVSVRLAAAKALGRIDGPQTTARLVAMTERNQSRREALIALADSHGPEARRFLAEAGQAGPLAGTVRSILLEQLQAN